ncbi:MAG TPA: bifunctional methylenetetrahydrofolate dehydrogenase/methenyltetrahydrofolate cyclohydrolase FolD [Stellaceae bacterium]|nr:bifunctional methylenetetrahydrofolate dehydrogenase/methenyltetrahydrofolate cyclohydrolase FolD [Stellaceae bacterium]
MDSKPSDSKIIDGKAFADGLRQRIAVAAASLRATHGLVPGLAVVLVGDDPASQVYVRNKGKATVAAGLVSVEHRLAATASQGDLLALIGTLNCDPAIHGILVQLPLPAQIDPTRVIEAIDPAKDVDGLHVVNIGRLWAGIPALAPCTPLGCVLLLKDRLGDLTGASAVVIGRSNLVGKPLAAMLLAEGCTVSVGHSKTRDLPALSRGADILVAAVGRPGLVRGGWIKPGATVIDVGINRVPVEGGGTRLVGDVAFDEALPVVDGITPVPGGVGPMTIACLLRNTVTAACRSHGIEMPSF